jgi:hypothetical protein
MKTATATRHTENRYQCLSCGTIENMGNRKYCSVECRQNLRHKLNIRTGLLKALHTRYAVFYFTDKLVIMDVTPYGTKEIFSFLYPRSPEKIPAEDFSEMADILGEAWWAEKGRTNKSYLATRCVFEKANQSCSSTNHIMPQEIKIPRVKGKSLIHLKLDRASLETTELKDIIKNAFRRQAKISHPDLGGNAAAFRKIHQAYEDLITWAESPSFIKRIGFPDKWFYEGNKNKWVQPTPSG